MGQTRKDGGEGMSGILFLEEGATVTKELVRQITETINQAREQGEINARSSIRAVCFACEECGKDVTLTTVKCDECRGPEGGYVDGRISGALQAIHDLHGRIEMALQGKDEWTQESVTATLHREIREAMKEWKAVAEQVERAEADS